MYSKTQYHLWVMNGGLVQYIRTDPHLIDILQRIKEVVSCAMLAMTMTYLLIIIFPALYSHCFFVDNVAWSGQLVAHREIAVTRDFGQDPSQKPGAVIGFLKVFILSLLAIVLHEKRLISNRTVVTGNITV